MGGLGWINRGRGERNAFVFVFYEPCKKTRLKYTESPHFCLHVLPQISIGTLLIKPV